MRFEPLVPGEEMPVTILSVLGCCGRSLGGEAAGGEWLVRCCFPDIPRRRGSFFLDLGEQPGLNRGGGPLSFRIIVGEAAGFEDDGAQFSGAATTRIVEVDKRKAGPGHCVLQE